MVLFARSIKPLEGSRPWLRRTRALMEIEWGKTAVRSVAEAVRYSRADNRILPPRHGWCGRRSARPCLLNRLPSVGPLSLTVLFAAARP
jgi:hypothetical protein